MATVGDLLHHYPRDYFDARETISAGSVVPGSTIAVEGVVRAVDKRRLDRRRTLVTALLEDDSGAVPLVWFNQPWVADQIRRGDRLRVVGSCGRFRGRVQITPVEYEKVDRDASAGASILPIYPLP